MTTRILKLMFQAVLVQDDGENLTEIVCDPVTVGAVDIDNLPKMIHEQLEAINNPKPKKKVKRPADRKRSTKKK